MEAFASMIYLALLGLFVVVSGTSSADFLRCAQTQGFGSYVVLPGTSQYTALIQDSWVSNAGWTPVAFFEAPSSNGIKAALKCARQVSVVVCPRSGGHSKMGGSLCNGIVLDLARMNRYQFAQGGTSVVLGAGLPQGELLYHTVKQGPLGKFPPVGECPPVGLPGFMLGGGLIEMDGRYGLGCDNLLQVQYVLANGSQVSASATQNTELFWASCGGGGGYFGVAFGITLRLRDRSPYDRNSYFRYDWGISRAAQVLRAYSSWTLSGGKISLKLKSDFNVIPPVIRAFGVCWEVDSANACEAALNATPVFKVPGRIKRLNQHTTSLLDALKFMSKSGNYGQKIPPPSFTNEVAFLDQLYGAASKSNSVRWANTVSKYNSLPSLTYYQNIVNYCASTGINVCNWRRIGVGVRLRSSDSTAFPFRQATEILYVAIKQGPSSVTLLNQFFSIQQQYTVGSYINYPNQDTPNYKTLYWGTHYTRLANLKRKLDPTNLFFSPQPL